MQLITVWLHGSKESMRDQGERAGLTGAALDKFMYACYEVKMKLRVDEKTGNAAIVTVDDRRLADESTDSFGDQIGEV
jgi:hypothetical protein